MPLYGSRRRFENLYGREGLYKLKLIGEFTVLTEKEIQEYYEDAKEGLQTASSNAAELMLNSNSSIIDYQHELCNVEFFKVRCQLLEYILEIPKSKSVVKHR